MNDQPRIQLCYRSIIAVDIEDSTTRTNPQKAVLRKAMYDLFEEALQAGGIAESDRDGLIDRGDGILALVHPTGHTPKTRLLNEVVPTLSALLSEHNARHPEQRFRLRVVVHAGEVLYDWAGCFGEALDIAVRLLDAPDVKSHLRQMTAPLVLVVSDDMYRAVVRRGHAGVDARTFGPVVTVHVADSGHRGWIHVPLELPSSAEKAEHRLRATELGEERFGRLQPAAPHRGA